MSATFSDGSYDLYYTHGFTLVAISLLAFFYLSSMKMCFGTYFLRTAFSNYKSNKVVRARYYELFTARDNLMYHISWAKSRGELEEARNLLRQLDAVDKVSSYQSTIHNFILTANITLISYRKLTVSRHVMDSSLESRRALERSWPKLSSKFELISATFTPNSEGVL